MQSIYCVWGRTQDNQICELKKGNYLDCLTEFDNCEQTSMIDVALFGPIKYDYYHILKNNIDVSKNPDIEIYC